MKYQRLFIASVAAFVGIIGFAAPNNVSAAVTQPTLTTPSVDVVTETKDPYIVVKGTTDPKSQMYIKVLDRKKRPVVGEKANSKGNFSFYFALKNQKKDKRYTISVYAKNPETKEMSAPTTFSVKATQSHATLTYQGAAVLDECSEYDEVPGATIKTYLTNDDAVPLVLIGTTKTRADGTYTVTVPKHSAVRLYASKEGYTPQKPHSISFDTDINYLNGTIINQMYLCGR